MRTYEPGCGENIETTAERMIALAEETGEEVTASFNEILLSVVRGTTVEDVVSGFHAECDRRREAYLKSPEYAQRQREAAEAQEKREREAKDALDGAPTSLTLAEGQEDAYREYVATNSKDGYSRGVVDYAARWARMMEKAVKQGKTLDDCADDLSHLADTEGITGFMYGCAVQALARFWVHGEQLRRWHNLKTQIGSEGEKANESGGTLNPALLNIG